MPADLVEVRGERLRLPEAGKTGGVRFASLQVLNPGAGTTVPGALDAASVVVRSGAEVLHENCDYLLDHGWAIVRVGPSGRIHPGDWITVDYRYSLRRLDSRIRLADGTEIIRRGQARLTNPEPPAVAADERREANLFCDYFGDGLHPEVFPVTESSAQAVTRTSAGLIPRTLDKLRRGAPVKIVCWGDSVTVGFDASSPRRAYTGVFEEKLKQAFPAAALQVVTVAVSGSHSAQWLHPTGGPCNWERVAASHPDLITVEFVNDAGIKRDRFDQDYADIVARGRSLGAEIIFLTPHFTRPPMMGFASLSPGEVARVVPNAQGAARTGPALLWQADPRPYVTWLADFAARHQVAVADASSRWAHLGKEGLPYPTLLHNGINHPDDRGHQLFAEELMKCFASP
jgi:lysophospholipase L1-like esterase